MLIPIPVNRNNLNKKLPGFYGKFLHGANIETMFIQSVIKCDWLDNIKLIEEIEGSDKWAVRDLFQRRVDHKRINGKGGLIEYFDNNDIAKFFNPLTLVLLPMDGHEVKSDLQLGNTQRNIDIDEFQYNVSGDQEYFKFFEHADGAEYSHVSWDDTKVKIVAVDGQHRLTALKTLWNRDNPGEDISNMSIPVVLLGYFKFREEGSNSNLLEVVRSTFVSINSKAQAINESRRILLDDESVNCVCTQEIVEYAHSNDQASEGYDENKMPLMMIDWRGEESGGKEEKSPTAIFKVRDIYDWLHSFILGNAETPREIENRIIPRLSLDNLHPEFNVTDFPLDYDHSQIVRDQFKKSLLPAIMYTIENVLPFKRYIDSIRSTQQSTSEREGDTGREAFKWLNFGQSNTTIINRKDITSSFNRLCGRFGDLKEQHIPELLIKDIGIRSIWSSFTLLKLTKDELSNTTGDWKEFAEWYVELFNNVFNNNWYGDYHEGIDRTQKKYLTHVAYKPSGSITNYKPSDVNKGLGALIAMLIAKESNDEALKNRMWNDHSKDALTATVKKGIKTVVTVEMMNKAFDNLHAYNQERDSVTLARTNVWISEFHDFLEIED